VAVRPMTHFRIVRVRVAIIDVNDNAPVFPRIRDAWRLFCNSRASSNRHLSSRGRRSAWLCPSRPRSAPASPSRQPTTPTLGKLFTPSPGGHDADSGLNGRVRYVIVTSSSSAAAAPFRLVERSQSDVRLVLTSALDRETRDHYELF